MSEDNNNSKELKEWAYIPVTITGDSIASSSSTIFWDFKVLQNSTNPLLEYHQDINEEEDEEFKFTMLEKLEDFIGKSVLMWIDPQAKLFPDATPRIVRIDDVGDDYIEITVQATDDKMLIHETCINAFRPAKGNVSY